ncbi:hypothetical protein Lal_00036311 [Lupinus albus]|uniref:Putative transcription factor bHLH family n=1 Tax=Lupinus albus TaxID=3870 RepID=A0A6A5P4G1_LUPAL|nr:putative transcription factor bHLH family [Lupinus albus]KAF1891961.1 hypothetical protein Lal_00036311 [Lupinus albus]
MCLPDGERDRVRDMALEAMVYSQQSQQYPFSYHGSNKNLNNNNNLEKHEYDEQASNIITSFLQNHIENNYPFVESSSSSMLIPHMNIDEVHVPNDDVPISSDQVNNNNNNTNKLLDSSTISSVISRPKRRRMKSRRNKEDIENQRMTHIAVERNRRKQMNHYLSVLRSLMPHSYVQRGDQASIVGGAINFVKKLEQKLQFLGAKKEIVDDKCDASKNMYFSDFFTFPQYSTSATFCENSLTMNEKVSEVKSGIADIEVTMVETHANLKIRSKKRPKQLLKIITSLHGMHLTILHLNVNSNGEIVLYCFSVKVEDDCNLGTVDEIAEAVYQMLNRIQQDAVIMLNT